MASRSRRRKDTGAKTSQYSREEDLLRPVKPDADLHNWPSFELHDAVIFGSDGTTLVNGLDATWHGPFIVKGRIMNVVTRDEDEEEYGKQQYARKKPFDPRGEHIEIQHARSVCIGDYPADEVQDGTRWHGHPGFWMQGKRAWYEIFGARPQYTEIWRKAHRTISLYYGLLKIYETEKPQKIEKGPRTGSGVARLERVFAKYAMKSGNGMTIEEVEQHCDESATHFIQWFLEIRDEGWNDTYFKKWMMERHPDLVTQTREMLEKLNKEVVQSSELPIHPAEPTRRKRSTRSGSVAEGSPQPEPSNYGARTRKQQSKEPRSSAEAATNEAQEQSMSDAPAEGHDPFESVVEALEWVHGQLYPRKELNTMSVASRLYQPYQWPTFKNGTPGCHRVPINEVLHYNASALLKRLDSSKWKSPFWDWLKKVSRTKLTYEALRPSDLPYTIIPRKSKNRSNKAHVVAPTKAGPQDEQHDDSNDFETPRRPNRGVKTPGRQDKSVLRLVGSSYKRAFDDVESDEEESPVVKRLHYGDDDIVEHMAPDDEQEDFDDEDKIELVIRADRIPSKTPKGRDGTWVCEEDDCNFVVRGGDADACEKRIEAHFKDHKQQGERIQLAMTESSRRAIPVNNLLEKLRSLGDEAEIKDNRQQEKVFGRDTELVKPIKRKLLV